MKSIEQIVKEHQAKLAAIRARNGTTQELIDQIKANNAEIVTELETMPSIKIHEGKETYEEIFTQSIFSKNK